MGDAWETYPCTMGAHLAFISFNVTVHERSATLDPWMVAFRVEMRDTSDEEFDRLAAIEDGLVDAMGTAVSVQVGRLTTNGDRSFYFYTSLDRPAVEAIATQQSRAHGRRIQWRHEHDPEQKVYRDELYPTQDDWRVIKDLRVERALRKAGDDLQRPRPIQHWAYFKSVQQRDAFVAELGTQFERVESYTSEQGTPAVTLFHQGLPDQQSMNAYTLRLDRLARQFDGDYDGWETPLCKSTK